MEATRKKSVSHQRAEDGESFNYEMVLEHVGQMGKFQWYVFILLCWTMLAMSTTVSSIVFSTGIPEYRCYVPGCDDADNPEYQCPWLNTTVPSEETSSGNTRPSRCFLYNNTWQDGSQCYEPPTNPNETLRCSQWVYDKTVFESTVVTEYDLTCRNEWVQPIVGATFMFGMLVGASIFGPIADKFGRTPAFIMAILWMSISSVVTYFSPNALVYGILRFVTGIGSIGTFIVSYVWGIEHVGPRFFVLVGFVFQCMGPVSGIIITGVAYASRDWKVIQLVTGLPALLSLLYWWLIPESPRWLLSKKRYTEAKRVISRVAKFNGKQIPDDVMAKLDHEINDKNDTNSEKELVPVDSKSGKVSEIFKTPILRKRILIMFLAWVAAEMGYFGLSMTSTLLGGDFYVNFLLSMVIEIPSYVVGIYIMAIIGRRFTLTFSLLLCGIGCLIAGFVPSEMTGLVLAFSLVAKFGASIVLGSVYAFTAELFPTATRSAAVGMCATLGRAGAVLAPIVAITARILFIGLPFIIVGIVDVVAGLVTLLLPETLGRDLPTTIEEAVELNSNKFQWRGFWPKTEPHV